MRRLWRLEGGGWQRGVIVGVAAMFVLAWTASPVGAGGASAFTSKSTTPAGYQRVTISRAGMTILVPDAWTKVDLTRHPIGGFIRQLKGSDPQQAKVLAQERDALALHGLYAAVDSQGGALGDQMTILAVPSADGSAIVPTGRGAELQVAYQTRVGFGSIQASDLTIDGAPGATLVGSSQIPTSKRHMTTVHGTAFIVGTQDGTLEIDFAGRKAAVQDKTLTTMIRSVTLDSVTEPFVVSGSGGAQEGNQLRGPLNGTPLGSATSSGTYAIPGQPPMCSAGPGVPFRGSINIATSNGDVLNANVSGTTCQSGERPSGDFVLFDFDANGRYEFTGGTGCFTGASGRGTTTSHVMFNSATSATTAGSFQGTITLKRQLNCPQGAPR